MGRTMHDPTGLSAEVSWKLASCVFVCMCESVCMHASKSTSVGRTMHEPTGLSAEVSWKLVSCCEHVYVRVCVRAELFTPILRNRVFLHFMERSSL